MTLVVLCGLVSIPGAAQLIHDGTLIDRANRWDGYPTHIFDEGKHRIWFCSQGPNYTDEIRFTQKSGTLGPGGWSWHPVVLKKTNVPWASHHICDPAVLRFDRSYQGTNYKYILYFTADLGPQPTGTENKIGVAFSNNRTSWVVHSNPVLSWWAPLIAPHDYGAGMSGISFDPYSTTSGNPNLLHVYFDSSFSTNGEPLIRSRYTIDGVNWFFANSPPDTTSLSSIVNIGHNPDIAYRIEEYSAPRWYAVVTDFVNPQAGTETRTRILRSNFQGAFSGTANSWTIIGTIDQSVTGGTQNNNPALAKHPDGRLYEVNGMGYVLVSTGPNDPTKWKIDQVRFSL